MYTVGEDMDSHVSGFYQVPPAIRAPARRVSSVSSASASYRYTRNVPGPRDLSAAIWPANPYAASAAVAAWTQSLSTAAQAATTAVAMQPVPVTVLIMG